jgi:hypothetical protein
MIKGYPDTFIMRRDGKAHSMWVKQIETIARSKKGDTQEATRKYAVACVYDWNGITDFDATTGMRLHQFLTDNPGIVTPLTNACAELVGVYEDSKSD